MPAKRSSNYVLGQNSKGRVTVQTRWVRVGQVSPSNGNAHPSIKLKGK